MAENPDSSSSLAAEFELLVVCYLDGQPTAEEMTRLNELLRSNESWRDAFTELCMTRAGLIEQLKETAESDRHGTFEYSLADEADSPDLNETMVTQAFVPPADEPVEEPEFKPTPFVPAPVEIGTKPPRIWPFAAGILLVLTTGLLTWLGHRSTVDSTKQIAGTNDGSSNVEPIVQPPTTEPTAVVKDLGILAQTIDARWSPGLDSDLAVSSKLGAGVHQLLRGIAKVTFGNGTSVVVQGPARFEVESDTRIHLLQGTLSVRVPHTGISFSVIGPDMNAVDLGTEFGMEVKPDQQTRLEVFDGLVRGEVKTASGETAAQTLSANHAVLSVAGSGSMQQVPPTPLAFVRPAEMTEAEKTNDTPFNRWLGFSMVLRQDPDLVAYYPFDNKASNPTELVNRAAVTLNHHNGVFGNGEASAQVPRWSTGRWADKDALVFGDNGPSAVTFANPADMIPAKSMTLGIWLKRTEARQAVHLLNGTIASETHFNLNLMGTAGKTALKLQPQRAYFTWSDKDEPSAAVLPSDDRWYFLAVTSSVGGSTHFYFDGQLVSTTPCGTEPVAELENLVLGEPAHGNKDADARDMFHGVMDEMMIFRRELSQSEIQRIYNAGGRY